MSNYENVGSQNTVADFASVLERSFSPTADRSLRVPFYLTSTYRQKYEVPGVSMLMNPQTVSFSQAKRITRKDTQAGAIFYHWTNRLGRNNDILEMNFSGMTGNINVRSGGIQKGIYANIEQKFNENGKRGPLAWLNQLAESTTSVDGTSLGVKLKGDDYTAAGVSKLVNFFNLYSLTREPMVDPKTGEPIYYYLSYSSPLFANTFVTFIGHFNKVLEFSEDANSPFNVNYSFGFTAQASIPSMDAIYTTISSNLSYLFMNPIDTAK